MANIYEPRDNVNSLFGLFNIDRQTGIVAPVNADIFRDNVYDHVLRGKNGIQMKIKNSEKMVNALANPSLYLENKRNDLMQIAVKLDTEFETSFRRHISRNIPLKEARENTKKDVDELYDKLMKFHQQDFPDEIVQRLVKKMVGGN